MEQAGRTQDLPPVRVPPILRSGIRGAVAGLAATAAMTVVMAGLRPVTRGDLAPRRVTGWLLDRLRADETDQRGPVGLSMVNHAAYGAALGALYGVLCRPDRAGPLSGLAYGVAVWAANYIGLLPALGVLPTPDDDVTSRALRVHASHWVYGAVLGSLHRGGGDPEPATRHPHAGALT